MDVVDENFSVRPESTEQAHVANFGRGKDFQRDHQPINDLTCKVARFGGVGHLQRAARLRDRELGRRGRSQAGARLDHQPARFSVFSRSFVGETERDHHRQQSGEHGGCSLKEAQPGAVAAASIQIALHGIEDRVGRRACQALQRL
jgi:hypothetical protein